MKLELSIYGKDFYPNILTKKLEIVPTEVWTLGDDSQSYNAKRKETAWNYTIELETLFLEDLTDNILEVFYQKRTLIKDFVDRYSLGTRIQIYAEFEQESAPSIYQSKKFIEFAKEISADIDIDLFILPKKQ